MYTIVYLLIFICYKSTTIYQCTIKFCKIISNQFLYFNINDDSNKITRSYAKIGMIIKVETILFFFDDDELSV